MITKLRNKLYDLNFFESKTYDEVKIIAIGNLCAGGSGKTPLADFCISLLKQDFKVAMLSRGYKRKTDGFILAGNTSNADEIGDEPMFIHTKHNDVLVAVDRKRTRGISKLLTADKHPDVIILDDAFQHRSVKAGLTILLTEYNNLFINDFYLPAGRLRESKDEAARADIIIVTKTPSHASSVELRSVVKDIKPLPYQHLFFAYINYGTLYHLFDQKKQIDTEQELYKYSVLLVSGIAANRQLLTYIKEYANDVSVINHPDHFDYKPQHIEELKSKYNSLQSEYKLIITTEKDAVKLKSYKFRELWNEIPVYVLPIEIDFGGKTEEFNELIQKYVRSNKIYHAKYSAEN